MRVQVKAEWHKLREVMVHKPGIETFFGLLSPKAFLYEGPFNYMEACREHDILTNTLKNQFGVKVYSLREIILDKANRDSNFKDKLINNARSELKFENNEKVKEAEKEFWDNIGEYDAETFFNILILRPTVDLGEYDSPRIILKTPLANLYFMRDQQAVGDKGVIIGHPMKPQREKEPLITKLAFEALNADIVCEVNDPGTFEGGDFMPMGEYVLIGSGERTNSDGINQILKSGVDFPEVVIISNPYHKSIGKFDPMITMHLDTYFNIAGENIAIGHRQLLENAKVKVYIKEEEGEYKLQKETSFLCFLKEKDIDLIDITTLEQLSYASNFLCIENSRILAVDTEKNARRVLDKYMKLVYKEGKKEYEQVYQEAVSDYQKLKLEGEFFPHKKKMREYGIDFISISIQNLSGGFGGIHCMTCPLLRS